MMAYQVRNKSGQEQNSDPVLRICLDGLFVALSMIFSYLESLIPFYFGAPGIKIGLANLVVLFLLLGNRKGCILEGIIVNLSRILLTGFLFGNMYSILYSLFGAAFSMLIMVLLVRVPIFKGIALPIKSAICGMSHNLAQLLVAFWVLRSSALWYYLPVLMLGGAICGLVTGTLFLILAPYMKRFNR